MHIYDVDTGEPLREIVATGPVGALRYSPDSRWLLGWSRPSAALAQPPEFPLDVWNTTSGERIARLEGHTRRTNQARFSHSGSLLATASDDATVRVWELPSGICRWTFDHPGKVHDVAFSPDDTRLASAGDPGETGLSTRGGAFVFDLDDGRQALELHGHRARAVHSVDWSADGRRLLSASYDGSARFWDAADGRELGSLRTSLPLVDARFLRGEEQVLARQLGHSLIARVDEGRGSMRTLRHGSPVMHAAFSADGNLLATGDMAGTVLVHDARTGELRARLAAGDQPLTSVAFCRAGAGIVASSSDGNCRLFDIASEQCVTTIEVGDTPVTALHVLADGQRFLATSGSVLTLFELASGRRLQEFRGHEQELQCIDVSPDEKFAASGARDRTVRIWDIAGGLCTRILIDWRTGPLGEAEDSVYDVAFSPSGRELLCSTGDGCRRCYDVATGKVLSCLGPGARVGKSLWIDGGRQAVSMCKWYGPVMWVGDPSVGEQRGTLTPEPIGRPTAMDVSPDGARLLVSSTDGRTLFWDLADRSAWAVVAGHAAAVTYSAFSPDGSCFVTTSVDGTARLWPTDPEKYARANLPQILRVPAAASPERVR